MKKKIPAILLCLSTAFIACDKDTTPTDPTVVVTSVTLDKNTLELSPQQSEALNAVITPDDATNKKITWSSDDTATATVSASGVVTGIKAGTTTIWARSAEDGTIADKCLLTVTSPAADIVEVSKVTLDVASLTVEIDQTKALTATVAPENATDRSVSWSSSDPTIATVSKTGSVTGLIIGTATITVTSNANSEKLAVCEVRVTEKSIPATDMWMKTTKLELKIGESGRLDAATIPTNTTDQTMMWQSDDNTIATVDAQGVVTGIKAGVTNVWVKWGPDNSIKDKCAVTVLGVSSYAIGDLYPDSKNPIGVVFWKDPADHTKGKIVSLTETRTQWATEYVTRNTSNENDGAANMAIIKSVSGWMDIYPAFKWCVQMGNGWYLPAISELKAIYDTKDAINAAIATTTAEDAVELDNNRDYWTSTERALSPKLFAVTIQFYEGYGGGGAPAGGTSFSSKDGVNNTRAIMKF